MSEFQATLNETARGTLAINEILLAMVSRPWKHMRRWHFRDTTIFILIGERLDRLKKKQTIKNSLPLNLSTNIQRSEKKVEIQN